MQELFGILFDFSSKIKVKKIANIFGERKKFLTFASTFLTRGV